MAKPPPPQKKDSWKICAEGQDSERVSSNPLIELPGNVCQNMSKDLSKMFKLDLEKAEKPKIKLPTSAGSSKKQEFQKNICCFMDYTKPFDHVDHNRLWKILKEMGISDHLTLLLRNLYAG